MSRPSEPKRPIKPQKILVAEWRDELYDLEDMTIQELLDKLPQGVTPERATFDKTWDHDEGNTYALVISDYHQRPNPNYESEMKDYENRMVQYGIAMNNYRYKLAEHEKQIEDTRVANEAKQKQDAIDRARKLLIGEGFVVGE